MAKNKPWGEKVLAELAKNAFPPRYVTPSDPRAALNPPMSAVHIGEMPLGPMGGAAARGVAPWLDDVAEGADELYDARRGLTIPWEKAKLLIRKHGMEPTEFIKEAGKYGSYHLNHVLKWLGY